MEFVDVQSQESLSISSKNNCLLGVLVWLFIISFYVPVYSVQSDGVCYQIYQDRRKGISFLIV